MAIVLCFFLAVAFWYSIFGDAKGNGDGRKQNKTLMWLSLGFLVLLSILVALFFYYPDWRHRRAPLWLALLGIGTMNTLYATYDIYEDTVARVDARSDAYKMAQICCGSPKCWGATWGIMAIAITALSLWGAILLLESEGDPPVSFGETVNADDSGMLRIT
jgi:hypothetical protein